MDDQIINFIVRMTNEALLLVIVVSGPPVLLSMIVGLTISLFQAVTQIQEMTLTFVPKMIIIFASLAMFGPWLGTAMYRFTQMAFETFPELLH